MISEVKVMSLNEIKKLAVDSWALITDPVYSVKNGKLTSGQLLYFNKDKEKVHRFILKEAAGILHHYTIYYTGKISKDQIFVL